MLNILVTGTSGQLGSELHYLSENKKELCEGWSFFFTDRKTLDITNKSDVENFCTKNAITHIINCAAYTAVDKAESEPELADLINHLAVKYIAEVAKQHNISVIYISTDYVFDGTNHKPYVGSDKTNPQRVYGQTKLDGENALRSINPKNSIIIHTSWVYSSFGNNFVKTMLKLGQERDELGVIFDQIGTPTYARDLTQAILQIIPQLEEKNSTSVEIYHYSNEGVCSLFDFTTKVINKKNVNCIVYPIITDEYPTLSQRPFYSVLNKDKIKSGFNLAVPSWSLAF